MRVDFKGWVEEMLAVGFPNDSIKRRAPETDRPHDTAQQPRLLPDDMPQLRQGVVHIAHPRATREVNGELRHTNRPHFPSKLTSFKSKVKAILGDAATFMPDFLYTRNSPNDAPSARGRAIFEYDPNFNNRRMGMLLFEDGGEKANAGDTGPGGPFYFDFGPAQN